MSESNEMFDEKFDDFFSNLYEIYSAEMLSEEELKILVDAILVAPETVEEYLNTRSRLIRLQATVEARMDHEQGVPMQATAQRGLNRTELVQAHDGLIGLWRTATASIPHEEIPSLFREYLARRI